jgi:hypothetical protein
MFCYPYMVHNERAYIGDLVSGGGVNNGVVKPLFMICNFCENAYIWVALLRITR